MSCSTALSARSTMKIPRNEGLDGNILQWIDRLPWALIVLLCLTLGLAPFAPPHLLEKLQMLFRGNLVKPLDWFDLLLHSFPWMLMIAKSIRTLSH